MSSQAKYMNVIWSFYRFIVIDLDPDKSIDDEYLSFDDVKDANKGITMQRYLMMKIKKVRNALAVAVRTWE